MTIKTTLWQYLFQQTRQIKELLLALIKDLRHGLLSMNRANGIRQQRRHRQLDDLRVLLGLRGERNGVQHDHLLQHGLGDVAIGSLAEESMRREREYALGYP